MRATILVDNKAGDKFVNDFRDNSAVECEPVSNAYGLDEGAVDTCSANACGLEAEWGLAIFIEYEASKELAGAGKDLPGASTELPGASSVNEAGTGIGAGLSSGAKKILLDTGASGLFATNAEKLGIRLEDVDFGVLSHAHYDHADGMETFFEINKTAPFYLSSDAEENCYSVQRDEKSSAGFEMKYDGIKQGTLRKYADRIKKDKSLKYQICDGVYLLGHSTPGLDAVGERVGQYIVDNFDLIPDDFAHEQSLIFETNHGLVVFNSCSHSGVDVIIREAQKAFPGQSVYAMIGGFHIFMDSEEEVREHARRIKAAGCRRIITGHCTGEEQYRWLKDELEKEGYILVEQLNCGLVVEL